MTSRTRPTPLRGRRLAVGAAAVLVLGPGLGTPVTAAAATVTGVTAGPSAAGDDGNTPGDGLTLSPDTGEAGDTVGIRADCETARDGTVSSPAFVSVVSLRPAGDGARARATVRHGLRPGSVHVVTANCSDRESLTSTFVHGGGRPSGPADAGRGERERSPERTTGVGKAALAFGGGLATAALAGYLLTARAGRAAANRAAALQGKAGAPTAAGAAGSGPLPAAGGDAAPGGTTSGTTSGTTVR